MLQFIGLREFVLVNIIVVDDELVEKLLQLVDDVDTSDGDGKTENLSLKSVAGMLYRRQHHTYSVDSDSEECCDVPDDADEPRLQQVLPAASAGIVTSASDFCGESQVSVSLLNSGRSFISTTSVAKSYNTVTTVDCLSQSVDTTVTQPSANVQHFPKVPTSSSTAPKFCVPVLPVLSPNAVSAHRERGLDGHVHSTTGQIVYYDGSEETTDKNCTISPADAVNIAVVSSHNIRNMSACSQTSLWNVTPLHSWTASSSVPSSSSSRPVLSSDRGHMLQCSGGSNEILRTTAEAVSRVCELLTARCKVLILMRGCPGSGKTTVAMYVLSVFKVYFGGPENLCDRGSLSFGTLTLGHVLTKPLSGSSVMHITRQKY